LDRFGVTAIDKSWLGKQRRAYHKHDGFPEHPVRVKHHQEYFAGDPKTPESKPQPIAEEESVVEQTHIDIPRIEDTREQLVGKHTIIPYDTGRVRKNNALTWLEHLGFEYSGTTDFRDIKERQANPTYLGELPISQRRLSFLHPILGRLELTHIERFGEHEDHEKYIQEISNLSPNFEPELRELEFLSFEERLWARQNFNLTFMAVQSQQPSVLTLL